MGAGAGGHHHSGDTVWRNLGAGETETTHGAPQVSPTWKHRLDHTALPLSVANGLYLSRTEARRGRRAGPSAVLWGRRAQECWCPQLNPEPSQTSVFPPAKWAGLPRVLGYRSRE